MGAWSTDIMGSDTAYDVNDEFEDLAQPVSSEQAIDLLANLTATWGEDPVLRQALGFVMIEKGYPMSADLKAAVIRGIDDELGNGNLDDWGDPDEREKKLQAFKQTVTDYPVEGGSVSLPHQEGLFEVILKRKV